MTIKDMEQRSGLPRANIRYYEAEGLLKPTRSSNGYRDYSEEDLTTLLKIKLLRELGCSLEEIAALQREEAALSDVLSRRLAALEGDAVSLTRAKALCAHLQADCVTYATLEPSRYLSADAPSVVPWEPIPPQPPHYPWRRFFARCLDLALAQAAVIFLLALVFNVSIRTWAGVGGSIISSLLSLLVVVIAEPLMLHRWGATPGKWAFRLRLVQENGAPLSYEDAFGRTLNVLLAGCGLCLPLVGFVTYILSFYRDCKNIEQPWAVDGEVFEDAKPGKSFHALRGVALYALGFILAVGLMTCGELKVARLPYPHPTTVSQFAANYNKIVRYQNRSLYSPMDLLADDGSFQGDGVYDGVEYIGLSSPFDFTYHVTSSGQMDAVSLDLPHISVSSGSYYPGAELAHALLALEGNYALFPSSGGKLAQRGAALLTCDPEGLARLPAGRWEVSLRCAFSDDAPIPSLRSVSCDFRRAGAN